jgi:hypothetical protein
MSSPSGIGPGVGAEGRFAPAAGAAAATILLLFVGLGEALSATAKTSAKPNPTAEDARLAKLFAGDSRREDRLHPLDRLADGNPMDPAALGSRFNIRAFHEQVLSSGALPLPVLEAKIDRWIAGQR